MSHAKGHKPNTDPSIQANWDSPLDYADWQMKGSPPDTAYDALNVNSSFKGNLPEGVTHDAVSAAYQDWLKVDQDPDTAAKFEAWVQFWTQFYSNKFTGQYQWKVKNSGGFEENLTISSDEAILYAALIAAKNSVKQQQDEPGALEDGIFTQAPEPNTIQISVMSKSADGSSTPQDFSVKLDPALFNVLLRSPLVGSLGEKVYDNTVIKLYTDSWWDLADALRNPDMLQLSSEDLTTLGISSEELIPVLSKMYQQLDGEVTRNNGINPREYQMPALSAELIKTGLAYSYDPLRPDASPTIVDLMPWIGPSPASVRWIPRDANDKTGAGQWFIDPESELAIGTKSLSEGVPASVKPWLQAVLNAGGNMDVIDQAFPDEVQAADPSTAAMVNTIKHWVGYILGQARLASDPRYAKQPVSIPMGAGEPPLDIAKFDVIFPNFLASTNPGMTDYGLGARAGAAFGATEVLQAGGDWLQNWNDSKTMGQIGLEGRYSGFPPNYSPPAGKNAGVPTTDSTAPMDLDSILNKIATSLKLNREQADKGPTTESDKGPTTSPMPSRDPMGSESEAAMQATVKGQQGFYGNMGNVHHEERNGNTIIRTYKDGAVITITNGVMSDFIETGGDISGEVAGTSQPLPQQGTFSTTLGRYQGAWGRPDWDGGAITQFGINQADNGMFSGPARQEGASDALREYNDWLRSVVTNRNTAMAEVNRLKIADPNGFIPEGLLNQAAGKMSQQQSDYGTALKAATTVTPATTGDTTPAPVPTPAPTPASSSGPAAPPETVYGAGVNIDGSAIAGTTAGTTRTGAATTYYGTQDGFKTYQDTAKINTDSGISVYDAWKAYQEIEKAKVTNNGS